MGIPRAWCGNSTNIHFPAIDNGVREQQVIVGGGAYSITIDEQVFRGNGEKEPDAATAAALTTLANDLAVRAWVEDENHFYLQTNSGYVIDVPSEDNPWESWDFNGPDGSKVVCMPEGNLVRWSPVEPNE